jgi:type I restriction enzyme S subunit
MKITNTRLSDLCTVITKGTTPTTIGHNFTTSGIVFLRAQNIQGGTIDYEKDTLYIDNATHNALGRSKIFPGDILVSIAGTIGRVGIVPPNVGDLNCNQAVAILRITNKVSGHYLRYWLECSASRGQISSASVKGTISNLSLNQIGKIRIPLPPLPDQIRIAAVLTRAEKLIAKRKESIKALDELLKSTFLEMFGDPFSNPKKLPLKTLEEIAVNQRNAIVDGPFGSSLKMTDYHEEGIPIIRINNIRDSGFYSSEFKFILETKYNELIRSKVVFNDVLIARVGNTIGKTCVFNQHYKALLSTTGVAKVTLNCEIADVDFIIQQLRLPQYIKYIWNQTEGGGQPYLNLTKIKAFRVLLPPMKQQNLYTAIVDKIESLKFKYAKSHAKLENLYGSLSQRAFKGELDLIKIAVEQSA